MKLVQLLIDSSRVFFNQLKKHCLVDLSREKIIQRL